MQRFLSGMLAICAVAAALSTTGEAADADQPQFVDHPHYLFLVPTNHGYGHFVPAQTYAYGWFGVSVNPHAVFHWDYYDHRWIWW